MTKAKEHEVLGDNHGLDATQVAELAQHTADINEQYPNPADRGKREKALAVARELLAADGDDAKAAVVDRLGLERQKARQAALDSSAGLRQAARMLVERGKQGKKNPGVRGLLGFAKVSRVDRMTILKWLGGGQWR